MSTESVIPSNHPILCCLFFLLSSIFPSIKIFSNELTLRTRWPKHWGFGFSISPSNEQSGPGLTLFRIDWFDFLAVQWTLKSLLQHCSLKASILWSTLTSIYGYIALTIWTSVSKVMSLCFNTLFGFVITFLPRNKYFLISWLQSLSSVILEPKKIKSVTVSIVSPSICHEVMRLEAMVLVFLNVEF